MWSIALVLWHPPLALLQFHGGWERQGGVAPVHVRKEAIDDLDEFVVRGGLFAAAGFGVLGAALGIAGVPNVQFGPVVLLMLPMVVVAGHVVGWYLGERLTHRRAARSTRLRWRDVAVHGVVGWAAMGAIFVL